MDKNWTEVILHIPAETLDVVSESLFGSGAVAVTELVHDHRYDLWGAGKERVEVGERPTRLHIKALYPQDDARNHRHVVECMLRNLAPFFPGVENTEIIVQPLEDQDWNEVWRTKFSVTPLSPRLVIRPNWIDYTPTGDEIIIHLEALMAFGTGTHETTRSCAKLIEGWMADHPQSQSLLDVGTGTGILAIIGVKLGIQSAKAIDIDPLAVEASQINVDLNQVRDNIVCDGTPVGEIDAQYNLVTANILAGALIELKDEITQCVAPAGGLILSGILSEQAATVIEAYATIGWQVETRIDDGEWVALLVQRSA